jgi:hypothetical protein
MSLIMVLSIKGSGLKKVSDMGVEFKSGRTEVSMRAIGRTIWLTAGAD